MFRLPLCFAVVGALAMAHELGGTRAAAAFSAGKYTIEVVTDATALAEKIHRLPGDAPASPAALKDLLNKGAARFAERVRVEIDGTTVPPDVNFDVLPAADAQSAPMAVVRLTGNVAEGAQSLRWTYGWTFTTYSFTANGSTAWLEGGQPSAPVAISGAAAGQSTFLRYVALGFTHIVPHGLDHVLFVLGIYLLSRRWSAVLWQVTAFTVAHTITLGLGMAGLVTVPASIVEPLIALSIAYVAIENLFLSELRPWRVALVFGFGLLHGLGFAGVLGELGMPGGEFLTALAGFNLGVEAGQLTVIAAAFFLAGRQLSQQPWYRGRVVVPASLAIAGTAVFWTFERLG